MPFIFQKQKMAAFCLPCCLISEKMAELNCLLVSSRYALLIENDAIPNEHFFDVLEHVINEHLEYHIVQGNWVKVDEKILYVKLYHPEWLLGYLQLEPDR